MLPACNFLCVKCPLRGIVKVKARSGRVKSRTGKNAGDINKPKPPNNINIQGVANPREVMKGVVSLTHTFSAWKSHQKETLTATSS